MDDLLAAAGVELTGPGAVSAVKIRHAGLVLLPLDPEQVGAQQRQQEQQRAGGGAAARRLQTAAAFVPPSMLPSDAEEDSEEGEGDGGASQ